MGDWAKMEFGRSDLPLSCFVVAGGTPAGIAEQMAAALGEVTFHRHDVYERYLLRSGETEETILALQLVVGQSTDSPTYKLNSVVRQFFV